MVGIPLVIVLLTALNVLSFSLMAVDKQRAKRGRWRISERTLFISAVCFGGLGGVLGMFLLRHKTKHWYFRLFFPLMLAVQIVALVFITSLTF